MTISNVSGSQIHYSRSINLIIQQFCITLFNTTNVCIFTILNIFFSENDMYKQVIEFCSMGGINTCLVQRTLSGD